MAVETTYKTLDQRNVTLMPIAEGTKAYEMSAEFVEKTRKKEGEEDKVSGAWRCTIGFVFDGSEVTVESIKAKPKDAIVGVIAAVPGSASYDDYEDIDLEDDFWKQKITAPAAPKVNYTLEVDGVSLMDVRGSIEATLEAVEDNEEAALAASIEVGRMLCGVHAALNGSIEKTTAFVMGEGLGDNAGNMPHLVRLGKGTNAVAEAMRFGQASDELLSVLSYKTTSGKGLNRQKTAVTVDFVKAAARAYFGACRKAEVVPLPATITVNDKSVATFDAESAALFLKCVLYAKDGFNIDNALEIPLADLGAAADARAASYTAEFLANGGKQLNPYVDTEYAMIKKAVGYNLLAYEGSAMPGAHLIRVSADAITALNELEGAKVPDEEAIDKARASLIGKRTNALMAAAVVEVRKMIAENADAERRQEAEAEAEDAPELVNKKVREQFADLSALDKAVRLFRTFSPYEDWAEVMVELNALAKKKKDEAPTEADVAEDA